AYRTLISRHSPQPKPLSPHLRFAMRFAPNLMASALHRGEVLFACFLAIYRLKVETMAAWEGQQMTPVCRRRDRFRCGARSGRCRSNYAGQTACRAWACGK